MKLLRLFYIALILISFQLKAQQNGFSFRLGQNFTLVSYLNGERLSSKNSPASTQPNLAMELGYTRLVNDRVDITFFGNVSRFGHKVSILSLGMGNEHAKITNVRLNYISFGLSVGVHQEAENFILEERIYLQAGSITRSAYEHGGKNYYSDKGKSMFLKSGAGFALGKSFGSQDLLIGLNFYTPELSFLNPHPYYDPNLVSRIPRTEPGFYLNRISMDISITYRALISPK